MPRISTAADAPLVLLTAHYSGHGHPVSAVIPDMATAVSYVLSDCEINLFLQCSKQRNTER